MQPFRAISWAVFVLVAAQLAGCAAGSASSPPVAEAGTIQGTSAVLEVHGLSCPLCANNLDKELLRIPGVQSVLVDIGSGTVTLTLTGKTSVERQALAEAVRRSGFTLVAVRQARSG